MSDPQTTATEYAELLCVARRDGTREAWEAALRAHHDRIDQLRAERDNLQALVDWMREKPHGC